MAEPTQPSERKELALHPSLEEFKQFVISHRNEIEELREHGETYEDIFYERFYTENDQSPYRGASREKIGVTLEQYNKEEKRAEQWLQSHEQEGVLEKRPNKDWLYYRVNGGPFVGNEEGKLTRLYLNIQIPLVPNLFQHLIHRGVEKGLRFDTKIIQAMNESEINRPEQIVVYYPTSEEQAFLKFIGDYYEEFGKFFIDGIPKFAAPIEQYRSRETMRGVGAGDEPVADGSFGMVRSRILGELYEEAERRGMSVASERFPLAAIFRKRCEYYRIDPDEPAFNLAA